MSYEPDVPNIAALKNLVPTTLDYPRVRVLTLLQEFWFDRDSTVAPDDITVVRGSSALLLLSSKAPHGKVKADRFAGRWLRNPLPVPEWTAKRTWYQDNVGGNDENSGDQSAPVRSIAEIARRLRQIDSAAYTIDVVGQVESSDSVCFAPQMVEIKSPVLVSAQTVAAILIRGKRTDDASGTFTATTKTDPSTNAQATVTGPKIPNAAFKWSDYVGCLLEATWVSGSQTITVQAVILKALAPGVARVSEWVDPLTGNPILIAPPAPAAYAPGAGATYKILSLTSFAAQIGYSSLPPRAQLSFQDLTISSPPVPPPVGPSTAPGLLASGCTTMFASCRFTVPIPPPPAAYQFDCSIRACSVHLPDAPSPAPPGPQNFCQTAGGNSPRFSGCGLINARIQVSSFGRITLSSTVLQGGAIRGVDSPQGRVFGGLYVVSETLGIFDSPTGESAVTLRRGMAMQVQKDAKLYGSGNAAYGVEVLEGASLAIQTAVPPLPTLPPPTVTGASGDLRFEGAGTAISELQAGGLPTADPLTTWVHWASRPFSRNVLSYKTGARIISTA